VINLAKDIVKDIDNIKEEDTKFVDSNKKDSDKNKSSDPVKHHKTVSTWNFILALGLIFIVVVAASIIKFNIEEDTYEYNGFTFEEINGVWKTQVYHEPNLINLNFFYTPSVVENLSINPLIYKRIRKLGAEDYLFFAFDEGINNTAITAGVEISRLHKVNLLTVPPHSAIFDPDLNVTEYLAEEDDNSTIRVNCEMANDRVVIIHFQESNVKSGLEFADDSYNCINFYAKDPLDFRKYADKFVYDYVGIIR
jgi:hypothetical protein